MKIVMLLMVVVSFLSCSKNKPKIGDLYKGGYVFKVNFWGGGLCAATKDFKTGVEWGCYSQLIDGANGEDVGDGEQNSKDILGGCSDALTAATVCDVLVSEDQDDWYLPSIGELELMYNELHAKGIGNFSYTNYWSSTQNFSLGAWNLNFGSGQRDNSKAKKDASCRVRAIRSF
jgi:hypothetical protein